MVDELPCPGPPRRGDWFLRTLLMPRESAGAKTPEGNLHSNQEEWNWLPNTLQDLDSPKCSELPDGSTDLGAMILRITIRPELPMQVISINDDPHLHCHARKRPVRSHIQILNPIQSETTDVL